MGTGKLALGGLAALSAWWLWETWRLPNLRRMGAGYPDAVIFPTGTLYLFRAPGCIIPPHTHPLGRTHYTLVLDGCFAINKGGECLTVGPADTVDFAADESHSIEALQPGAIFNGFHERQGM